jgi:hypothetical protein
MSNWFKLPLLALALVLIGLSVQRYQAGGGLDWFSLFIAFAALGLLAMSFRQSDEP